MVKLTAKQLEALATADDGRVLREDGGLVGKVRAGVRGITVQFRFEFKLGGTKRDHRIGTWPKHSLAAIRAARDQARAEVAKGIDPTAAKRAARIEAKAAIEATIAEAEQKAADNKTVQDLFNTWVEDGVARKDGNLSIKQRFGKDVLPAIGTKPVREVTEHDIRRLLKAVVDRGCNRLSVALLVDIRQMFRWAEQRQPWRRLMIDGNPALLVEPETIVSSEYDLSNERDRILTFDEIRELNSILAQMQADYDAAPNKRTAPRPLLKESQIALWLCLSTLCRAGELLMAEWRHVDLVAGEWFIPAENTKGRRGKQQPQTVFLSNFAMRKFKELHALTGDGRWCFPATNTDIHVCTKSLSKQIGDRQTRFKERKALSRRRNDDSLVLAGGSNGEWTPHDLRRTGATMMQALGVSLDVIDKCQNHVLKGKVRRVYLRHDYAEEKREAWRLLGDRIEAILSADNVVELRRVRREG